MFWEEFPGSLWFWLQNCGMMATSEIQLLTAQHINSYDTDTGPKTSLRVSHRSALPI